jgi:hypothetical protein
MDFDGTPLNMSTILVTVLAVVAALMLLRKRYDSNLPLMFYVVAVIFTQTTERAVNPLLLYGGNGVGADPALRVHERGLRKGDRVLRDQFFGADYLRLPCRKRSATAPRPFSRRLTQINNAKKFLTACICGSLGFLDR